ncbi:MAG: hypothetical protein WAM53_05125 [Terrimicrobiaceae bacterium]
MFVDLPIHADAYRRLLEERIASSTVRKKVANLAIDQEEHRISCAGKIGNPFFGQLTLDCLNRTEEAMTQEHAFKAAELCLIAQAVRLQ